MIKYLFILSISLFLAACGATGLGKKAAWQAPHIFRQYNAESNSTLNHSWTSKIDTSGVSFNDKHTCTLITKRHVVMAKHYTRSMNTPVIFHDRNGKRVVRKLISIKPAYGDVAVGLLDKPVPSSLRIYPMPAPMANAHQRLVNKLVIVSNQFKQLHIHQIAMVANSRITFKFPEASHIGQGIKIISGDSGNPSPASSCIMEKVSSSKPITQEVLEPVHSTEISRCKRLSNKLLQRPTTLTPYARSICSINAPEAGPSSPPTSICRASCSV